MELREPVNSENFPLQLGDLGCCLVQNLDEKDNRLKTFLEIATSQYAVMDQ